MKDKAHFIITEEELSILDNMDQNDFICDMLERIRYRYPTMQYLSDDDVAKLCDEIRVKTRNEILTKASDMILEELHIIPGASFDPNNDRIPEIGIDVLADIFIHLGKGV